MVALLEWNPKFSVGVSALDAEHKVLIGMINSLHDAMKAGKGKELLEKILDDAAKYALNHFANEEKLMMQYRYPEYKEHKAIHDNFAKKVGELRLQSQQNTLSSGELLKILQDWLITHITDTDKKYGPFLSAAIKK